MPFETTYQGSVNRWECDENDHLNVRFYLHKAHQGLIIGAQKLCLLEHEQSADLLGSLRCHHIRFLREARVAVPLVGECGIVAWNNPNLQLFSQLRHALSGDVMATFVSDFVLNELQSDQVALAGPLAFINVPEYAQPRGITPTLSPYTRLSAAQALAHGYRQIGAGVIQPEECDANDTLLHWHYMGRVSDGMPNFWAITQSGEDLNARSEGYMGGAVLEYRMQFHQPLSRGQAFAHLAAVGDLGNKTQEISHLVYRASSGELVLSAEALGISLNLQTRKAVAIPDPRRRRLQALRRKELVE